MLKGAENYHNSNKTKIKCTKPIGKSDDGCQEKWVGPHWEEAPHQRGRDRKVEETWLVCCAQKFDKIQGINTLKYTKNSRKIVMWVGERRSGQSISSASLLEWRNSPSI